MKRKIGLTATSMPNNWVRVLYIIWKRKLRKIDENLLISLVAMAILLLQVFIIVTAVRAQEKPKGLQIGDRVPDVTITNIINHPTGTAKISDFKGKLLILDFWASWCGACLSTFPKADSLQRKFEVEVQFLPVTYQDEKEARRYFTLLNKRVPVNLPSVVADKTLSQLFPHKTIPHYVWIGRDGKIIAITGMYEVNAANISQYLQSGGMKADTKKDIRIPYSREQPFLVGNNGGDGKELIYHSVFTKYTQGLPGGFDITMNNPVTGRKIVVLNFPLIRMYRVAMGEGVKSFADNNVLLEVEQPELLRPVLDKEAYLQWYYSNSFCYELIVPPSMASKAFQIFQQDLHRMYPQYDVKVEKRLTKYLALVRTSKFDKMRTAGAQPMIKMDGLEAIVRNTPFGRFFSELRTIHLQKSALPVINETGYRGKVDLDIRGSLSDINSLNKELEKYDLKFIQSEKEIDMIVFRDTPQP